MWGVLHSCIKFHCQMCRPAGKRTKSRAAYVPVVSTTQLLPYALCARSMCHTLELWAFTPVPELVMLALHKPILVRSGMRKNACRCDLSWDRSAPDA